MLGAFLVDRAGMRSAERTSLARPNLMTAHLDAKPPVAASCTGPAVSSRPALHRPAAPAAMLVSFVPANLGLWNGARGASIALNGHYSIDLAAQCALQTGWGTCSASRKVGSHLDQTSWSPRNRTGEEPCVRQPPAGRVADRPRNNKHLRNCRARHQAASSTEGENISSRFRPVRTSQETDGEIGRDTTTIITS